MHLALTGAGAADATAVSSADNDNRFVSGAVAARSAAGVYAVTLTQSGRVLLNAIPSYVSAAGFYVLWNASLSGGVVTLKFKDAAGNAVDLASGDIANIRLEFKNSGA